MLSRTVEYAVRAVVVLARDSGRRSVSAEELASTLGAPRSYLSKTLLELVRHGIAESTRGPGGGYALAVSPDVLTVAKVADVSREVRPSGTRCLLAERPCDPARPCAANQRWSEITLGMSGPLLHTAIGELCGDRRTDVVEKPSLTGTGP